ncbi:hypothetical protein ACP6L2_01225 [Sphingobacterium lactis]|uniref:hypothetical protein n=1 Tax=Sphingobacterium lactis TaxID=797291 RepID=UPI003F820E2E
MWEKILAQLISKNPGVSKAVLTLIAQKLAGKVTEESQIEGAISDFEANSVLSIKDYADFVQKDGDTRVGEAKKKWDTENKKPEPSKDDQPPADKKDVKPDDINSIVASAVAAALKPIQEMASSMQNNNRLSSLKAQLKAKGIDESWAEDVLFNEEYNEENTVAKLETRWNNTIQAGINKQVSEGKLHLGNSATEEQGIQAIKDYGANKGFTKEAGYNIQEV